MKDELFLRGENVPMTKEAVRALALSKLELHRASHLIDVGAGTGSVSIEAALQFPSLQVTAIERNPAALRLLDENRQRFACGNIDILPGEAHIGACRMDCVQLQLSSLTPLGAGHYFKPNNPVFVIACQKEENHVRDI